MVLSPRMLASLPARPPTPPKNDRKVDSGDVSDALEFLEDSFEVENAATIGKLLVVGPTVDTPEDSPSSSAEPGNADSSKRSKRVGFSPWTHYHKASTALQATPPSREPKPLKSILKPRTPSSAVQNTMSSPKTRMFCSARKFNTFEEMLEAVIAQLGWDSREARLDAYMTLLTGLKAFADTLNVGGFQDQISCLAQSIKRDGKTKNTSTDPIDTQLCGQALKLLAALLRIPPLAASFNTDFCRYTLEQSISALVDPTTPKSIIISLLTVLAYQNFGPKILTTDRVERLLSALQDLESRVKGNSIIGGRLFLYRRLVEQSRSVMLAKISDWIEHVFHGMLSSVKDVRTHAIETGVVAGTRLGSSSRASQAVIDLLDRESEDGVTYGNFMVSRLKKVLDTKMAKRDQDAIAEASDSQSVPRIWTVVFLFHKGRRQSLQSWHPLKTWLELIQACFNHSDPHTKAQAVIAWNRLVYVVLPGPSTDRHLLQTLRHPVVSHLDRARHAQRPQRARKAAMSIYSNLLYYAFRPQSSREQLDLCWDEYVFQVLIKIVNTKEADFACRILAALAGSQARTWNEERATVAASVTLEELPRVDPTWVRQHTAAILGLIGPCLNNATWDSDSSAESSVRKLWISFMDSLGEAGRKEVKASMELKQTIADVVNLLHQIWTVYPSSLGGRTAQEAEWMSRFEFLVRTAIEKLGAMHFADNVLARTPNEDFEAAPTPSHRSRRTTLQSPVLHLLSLISTRSFSDLDEASYLSLSRSILVPCLEVKATVLQKVKLLKECAAVFPSPEEGVKSRPNQWLYRLVAELAESVVSGSQLNHSPATKEALQALRDVVEIQLASSPDEVGPAVDVTKPPASPVPRRIPRLIVPQPAISRLRHEDSQVQFVAIESSPPREPESQLLTEHQKEVKAKQLEGTAMFRNIGSSPLKQSEAPPRTPNRSFMMSSEASVPRGTWDGANTPLASPLPAGAIERFLDSSPTPSSARKRVQILSDATVEDLAVGSDSAVALQAVADEQNEIQEAAPGELGDSDDDGDLNAWTDPPSSPPQMQDPSNNDDSIVARCAAAADQDEAQDPTLKEIDPEASSEGDDLDGATDAFEETTTAVSDPEPELDEIPSSVADIQSTAQLAGEMQAYAKRSPAGNDATPAQATTHYAKANSPVQAPGILPPASGSTTVEVEEEDLEDLYHSVLHVPAVQPSKLPQSSDGSVSRAENSFIYHESTDNIAATRAQGEPTEASHVSPAHSSLANKETPRNNKKRKSTTPSSSKGAKRQKKQSPLKRLLTSALSQITGRRTEEEREDDDMLDEIAVASQPAESTTSWSFSSNIKLEPGTSPRKTMEPHPALPSTVVPELSHAPNPSSPTSQPSGPASKPSKKRPRRSATASERAPSISAGNETVIEDTPVPRKRRRTASVNRTTTSRSTAPDASAITRSLPRTLSHVEIPSSRPSSRLETTQDSDEHDVEEPTYADGEPVGGAAASDIDTRPKAEPKSIIARLRQIAADLRDAMLGSQEERELDDVLFEVRQNVHEAGRRTRGP
ncbi:hypothetical protein H2199_006007 [Coniosporium tulheliwenetii]|uniref:Uncharacterized protein n=1 Tax=Coniosporium tulheliwenetii TaxID=3383036 RepID=A0ACC2YZ83_9PEZI|nr:hypothetical protein H2199_006007 [Cladosporium sp. JES 115]